MTACIDLWEGGASAFETKTGVDRDFIGNFPPIGGITRNDADHGERKVAVIALDNQGQQSKVIESYSKRGYACVLCGSEDHWAMKSNLFFARQSATLVTDNLDLIWQVRLHDLEEGTTIPVHALVNANEVLQEVQALHLGAVEIFETESEPDLAGLKNFL